MVWIVGVKGMLGSELAELLKKNSVDFVGTDIEVDITDSKNIDEFMGDKKFSWIINCTGYTQVDKAETDIEKAYLINYLGVENLAKVSKKLDSVFIHFSTDYVFSGDENFPRKENDVLAPIGVYGKSKLKGEEAVKNILDKFFIIRTAWLYGKGGANFVFTMIRLMKERDSIKVVSDQIGSPTWAKNLAEVILKIVRTDFNTYGIYHFSGAGECNWYEFANYIKKLAIEKNIIDGKCKIAPCSTEEYPTPAKRPKYSLLDKDKIKKELKIKIDDWKISLEEFFYENF